MLRAGPNIVLGDTWVLSSERDRVVSFTGSLTGTTAAGLTVGVTPAPEGAVITLPLAVTAGANECVADVDVWIQVGSRGEPGAWCSEIWFAQMRSPCLSDLRLTLLGPGPARFMPPAAGGGLHVNPSSVEKGGMPRDYPAVLFYGGYGIGTASDFVPCDPNAVARTGAWPTAVFDDDGGTPLSECCAPEFAGRLSPVDNLSRCVRAAVVAPSVRRHTARRRYHRTAAAGSWSLQLHDSALNGMLANVSAWGVTLTMTPCDRTFTWTQVVVWLRVPVLSRAVWNSVLAVRRLTFSAGAARRYACDGRVQLVHLGRPVRRRVR